MAAEAAENAAAAAASIASSKETVDAAAAAVTGAQQAADRANTAAAKVEDMDVSALTTQINDVKAATTPTVLWAAAEGADGWASGSITVEGIGDWLLLDIHTGLGHMVGINTGTSINAGVSSRFGDTDNQQTVIVAITVAGNKLTLNAATRIRHKPDDVHGAIGSTNIKAITGLLKKGTATIQE